MGKIIQEKMQEEFPRVPEGTEGGRWVFAKAARVDKGIPGTKNKPPGGSKEMRTQNNAVFYNTLPPGQDIEDQEMADIRHQPESMSGTTDVSYDCPDAATIHRGYHRKLMKPTDDLYTNEHVDLFYGSVKVEVEDGVMEEGFLERGNMLDRG